MSVTPLFDEPGGSGDLSAAMRQIAMLAWLHAESVWHHGQTLEDYQRNDERMLAENQRLADENALLRGELDKVSGGWEARVASRQALIAERDVLRAQLEATLRMTDFQIGDIVCWRGDRWFEGRIVCETAPEHKYLDTEVWDLEVTDPGTRYVGVDMTGRLVHVSEEALVLVRRDDAVSTDSPSAASTKESPSG